MDINEISVRREGDRWIFDNGLSLPVISGGDGSTDTDPFTQGVVEGDPNAITAGFVNTPTGVLSGVEPPAVPANNATVQGVQANTQTISTTQTNPATGRMFTADEVEAARKQERDKLYADIEKEKSRRKELERAEKERTDAAEAARLQAEEEARRAAEAEMDARTFAETRIAEMEARLEEERQQREQLAATLDQERRFIQLEQYRAGRIEQERENVLPELIDLIGGNSEEEIEQSIESLRSRTASILGNVQQSVASARQGMQGASVTAPPVGPMDTQQSQQTISPDDIRNMTPAEYAQHRDRLLGAVRQQVGQRGIYGG